MVQEKGGDHKSQCRTISDEVRLNQSAGEGAFGTNQHPADLLAGEAFSLALIQ